MISTPPAAIPTSMIAGDQSSSRQYATGESRLPLRRNLTRFTGRAYAGGAPSQHERTRRVGLVERVWLRSISMGREDAVGAVEDVRAFFAELEVASLRLPSGWFGRPFDNQHQLTDVLVDSEALRIILDEHQVLTMRCAGPSRWEGRVLAVPVNGGECAWTEYGGTTRHNDQFGAGRIELHAP